MEEQTVPLNQSKKITIYQLCVTSLMKAVMCILGPMSVPIGTIPISLTNLVIYLSVYLLGAKLGTLSCIVYLLLGMAGLPVFSGYSGGLARLAGPTGGYLVGFIFMAFISGLFIEKSSGSLVWSVAGMILGSGVLYLFGTIWYVILMDCPVMAAVAACVQPFVIFDLIKIALATVVGRQVRGRLIQAGLIV